MSFVIGGDGDNDDGDDGDRRGNHGFSEYIFIVVSAQVVSHHITSCHVLHPIFGY